VADHRFVYVTAPDCHLCENGREIVGRLAAEKGFAVEEISWDSERGAQLVARDGAPFPPALYLGETLLAYGRVSERRLRRLLKEAA
jgi:hypothetical protein